MEKIVLLCLMLSSYGALAAKVPALFIFGDSLVDSGTNNKINNSSFKANFPPYGESFFNESTGRFTDGRHAADFIAGFLELPFARPFLSSRRLVKKGVNFASGGSGILDSTNKGKGDISLSIQVRQFARLTRRLQTDLLYESIYLIASGSNDIFSYLVDPVVTPPEFIAMTTKAYASSIQTLYKYGARKIVVFGLGPLGCVPSVRVASNVTDGSCVSGPNELAVGFNTALQTALEGLRSGLKGSTIVYANSFDRFLEMYKQANDQTGACCGAGVLNAEVQCGLGDEFSLCTNPWEFLFWDSNHLTQAAYSSFAQAFWSGSEREIFPVNISSLASI